MSSITVDTKELDKFAVLIEGYPSKVYSNVCDAVKKSTFNVEKYAKENLTRNGSVDTGLLRNSVNSKLALTTGTVSTNTKYARYVEEGTKPHIIRARKARFLYWNGAKHPVKQVNHKGSKAKPYMIPALEKEEPNFFKALEKAVDLP